MMDLEDRIERLRQHPTFRELVELLRRQTPDQIARLERDVLGITEEGSEGHGHGESGRSGDEG